MSKPRHLPFICCAHCECQPSDAIGHDDTCTVCQNADGTPIRPDGDS